MKVENVRLKVLRGLKAEAKSDGLSILKASFLLFSI